MKGAVTLSVARAASRYVCHGCRRASTFTTPTPWRVVTRLPIRQHGSRIQTRGAKRRTTITIKPVPQGALPAREPVVSDRNADGPVYSATIQQHLNNMRKFSGCVILTKLGNFYEMYFEQAEELAPLLNLKLAKKPTTRNEGGFLYMAGFPIWQMDRYLKILVHDLGRHVAISEEVRMDEGEKLRTGGSNMFDRRVVRIVTPGTLIDEKFMDPWENNFLLSIHSNSGDGGHEDVGLAWIDLSSGDFFTQKSTLASLGSAIARIGPRELLLDQSLQRAQDSIVLKVVQQGHHNISFTSLDSSRAIASDWSSMFADVASETDTGQFSDIEVTAGNLLLQYITDTQVESTEGMRLQAPVQRKEHEYMMIDQNSLRALEVVQTLRDVNFKGSLLHAVRRTSTTSGARLLKQRLLAPSMSLEEVNERLDLVQEMLGHPVLRQEVTDSLKASHDSLRLVAKFGWGRGDADDLLNLSKTIAATSRIAITLQAHIERNGHGSDQTTSSTRISRRKEHVRHLLNRLSLDEPQKIADRIAKAIDEEQLEEQHQLEFEDQAEMLAQTNKELEEAGEEKFKGTPKEVKEAAAAAAQRGRSSLPGDIWIMRRTASARLAMLHDKLDALFDEKDRLEAHWRKLSGSKKLSLRWMQPHGHVVWVTGTKEVTMDFSILGKISNAKSGKATRSFYHQEWTLLGNQIEKVKENMRLEEQRVFDALRKLVVKNIVRLRRNAAVLDELDVSCGFAILAAEKQWVRPLLNNGTLHHIRGGRHPTVEVGLTEQGKQFTANDCIVGHDQRILLITGPNMGGKSTFLRQNALLSILAQTGSFVPAAYAEIGLVDKIFSRVGSADNLYRDQSTFMVEMLETAEILKQATPKSFVIMDEVGRGTTPEDGIAVGFASLFHLYHVNRSRALFATHFHVLADMTSGFEKMGYFCTDVSEDVDVHGKAGSFSYVHLLREGVNRNPHALKVARLAGMPEEAVAVAEKVLEQIKAYKVFPTSSDEELPSVNANEKSAASG